MLNLGNGILYFTAQYVCFLCHNAHILEHLESQMDCSVNKYPSQNVCILQHKINCLVKEYPSTRCTKYACSRSLEMAFCIRVTCSFCLPFTIEIVNLWLFGKTAPNIVDQKSGSISSLQMQRQCTWICNDGHNEYHKYAQHKEQLG